MCIYEICIYICTIIFDMYFVTDERLRVSMVVWKRDFMPFGAKQAAWWSS